MMHIIDRRLNPKGKSLSNRQRFIKRASKQIKKAVDDAIIERKIANTDGNERIRIPAEGLHEPSFRGDNKKGKRHRVLPGNKDFMPGDKIKRPLGQRGGQGSEASEDGDGEDEFQFTLTKDEFLDIFFDGMELPDFVKTSIKNEPSHEYLRAGYRKDGSPSNLNLKLTMKNSLARRLCLRRPSKEEIRRLEENITILKENKKKTEEDKLELKNLLEELNVKTRRRKIVPYIDPMDVRFSSFSEIEKPNTHAVMFCLMDVSGSMGEGHKELAKKFFILLHLFLIRQYKKVDIVFIRHTHIASEVDEETFFHSRETGGTKVSSALYVMSDIIKERYPADDWNIYAAQASDGDNLSNDNAECQYMLNEILLPQCQYYAYVEIWDEQEAQIFKDEGRVSNLWQSYDEVTQGNKNFAIKNVKKSADIFPVLRDLFTNKKHKEGA